MTEQEDKKWAFSRNCFRYSQPPQTLVDTLPAGAYSFGFDMAGPYAKPMELKDEELIMFDSGPTPKMLAEVDRFWQLEDRYKKLGLPYRRGILMHGVPGTGKSAIVRAVCDQIIQQDGLVAYCSDASSFAAWIPIFNEREPTRRIVIVFEDLDNMIDYDESGFLELLDGIGNDRGGMLFIGSTNFLGNIPDRVYRPSRFDCLVEIGPPCIEVRRTYIQRLCDKFGVEMRDDIAEQSEGMSFAHMKEMLVSVLLYDTPVEEAAERMKMHGMNDEEDDD